MITNCRGQLLKVDLINNFVCQIVYLDNGCRGSWGLEFWALGPEEQRRFFYQKQSTFLNHENESLLFRGSGVLGFRSRDL